MKLSHGLTRISIEATKRWEAIHGHCDAQADVEKAPVIALELSIKREGVAGT